MDVTAEPAVCRFYRLIPGAPDPQPADRSADGTLPVVAYRYCEPIAAASGFGWYVFPPLNFALVWDGRQIAWTFEGSKGWDALSAAPYPDYLKTFRQIAPAELGNFPPTFLSQGKLPGVVQIWSGFVAETAPGYALLTRGIANLAPTQAAEDHELLHVAEPSPEGNADRNEDEATPTFMNYEGIIETNSWLGPLFTNVRLMRTNSPVLFHKTRPLFQVQPVLRPCYRDPGFEVLEPTELSDEQWNRLGSTMQRNADHMRRPGRYAVDTRRRLRRGGRAQ